MAVTIGTAGHVDHGKTSLVRALTGLETDSLAEEKKRGLSIDLGFAYMDLSSGREGGAEGAAPTRVAFVDVPGHERFIKNMLAGVSGIDIVLFCVAADDGVMPQTIEHLNIVKLLGVSRGVFALTKIDVASASRQGEVVGSIKALTKGTPLEGAAVVPLSTVTGEGMDELKGELLRLAEGVDAARTGGLFRLPVDRAFSIKGFGTVLTGTVASGELRVGEDAFLYPSGARVRVRGMESHHEKVERVGPGERAALNTAGVSAGEVRRGDTLTVPDMTRFFTDHRSLKVDCVFHIPRAAPGASYKSKAKGVKGGTRLTVHHLTGESPCTVRFHDRKVALPGDLVYGRLYLKKPLLLLRGDRFILRDPSLYPASSTVGGGAVLLPYMEASFIRGMSATPYDKLDTGTVEEVGELLVERSGGSVPADMLAALLNLAPNELASLVAESGALQMEGSEVVGVKALDTLKKMVLASLAAFHAERSSETGMAEEELLQGAGKPHPSSTLLCLALDGLESAGVVRRERGTVALGAHRACSTGEDLVVEEAVMAALNPGFKVTSAADLAALPYPEVKRKKALAILIDGAEAVKLREGAYLTGSAIGEAKEMLLAHLEEKGSIKASEFRDLLGCGRKLAIEILEYFDKVKVTLRSGEARVKR